MKRRGSAASRNSHRHRSRALRVLRPHGTGRAVGAPPGAVFVRPDSHATRITVYEYDADRLEVSDRLAAALPSARRGVTWVRVQGLASVDLLRRIAATFNVHELVLADIINANQRSKVERYEHHAFVILHTPAGAPDARFATGQIAVLLGHGFALTFEERVSALLDPVAERLRNPEGRLRRSGADYLAYAVIDTVIDSFFPLLESFGEHLEALETQVIDQPDRVANRAIHAARADLLLLRRGIWPLREIAAELRNGMADLIEDTTQLYLRDCYDHAVHLQESVEIYREMVFGLVELHLSSINARMNEIMKVLTVIATIFMPLGFIASLYGMNFDRDSAWNMPELGWRFGYAFALVLMVVTAGSMVWYFQRKGWVGRRRGEPWQGSPGSSAGEAGEPVQDPGAQNAPGKEG